MKLARTLLFPYFKRFWLMLLSVIFVGAFGCAILIGMRDSYLTLKAEVTNLIEECDYPDIYVETVDKISSTIVKELPDQAKSLFKIKNLEFRSTYTTTFEAKNNSYFCKAYGYDSNSFLKHHAVKGQLDNEGIRMEYYFAQANGFKVGDEIGVNMPDGSLLNLPIHSIIVSPETAIVKSDAYSINSARDFAYVYIPKAIYEAHDKNPADPTYNEILVRFIDGFRFKDGKGIDFLAVIKDLIKEIEEQVDPKITEEQIQLLKDSVAFYSTWNDSDTIKQYTNALAAIDRITIMVPIVFFLVVLVVTTLFLFQIVRQCRKDIGILRALGESKKDITLVFASLGLFIGILSWAVGVGIACGITLIANYAYGTALKLYPLHLYMNWLVVLIGLVGMVTVCVLTALAASLGISKIKPVEAMKALPPMNNNTPFLIRTVFKKSPITLKITISQTLRNLKRYILSGICLFASGMMIFFAMSLGISKNTMMDQLFKTRMNYDLQIYFDNLPTQMELDSYFEGDSNIKARELIKYMPSEMKKGEKEITSLINGVNNDQQLLHVVSDYDQTIEVPESGIILCSYHAAALDAKVGDVIEVNGTEMEVKAISRQYLYQVSYTHYNQLNGTRCRGSLLVDVENERDFINKYENHEHFSYISSNSVIKGEYEERMLAFTFSSYILNAISVILGFMIVFNMMQTNLKEQKRTFATMRTLGYQRLSISMSNLVISIAQYIFSMAFAIPIGMLLSKGLLDNISSNETIFPFPVSPLMYILTLAFVLGFLLISHFIAMSSMKKWNLPECVKERE